MNCRCSHRRGKCPQPAQPVPESRHPEDFELLRAGDWRRGAAPARPSAASAFGVQFILFCLLPALLLVPGIQANAGEHAHHQRESVHSAIFTFVCSRHRLRVPTRREDSVRNKGKSESETTRKHMTSELGENSLTHTAQRNSSTFLFLHCQCQKLFPIQLGCTAMPCNVPERMNLLLCRISTGRNGRDRTLGIDSRCCQLDSVSLFCAF